MRSSGGARQTNSYLKCGYRISPVSSSAATATPTLTEDFGFDAEDVRHIDFLPFARSSMTADTCHGLQQGFWAVSFDEHADRCEPSAGYLSSLGWTSATRLLRHNWNKVALRNRHELPS